MSGRPPAIALAIGDPNGIGPEIAVKAALELRADEITVILVGDRFVIDSYARPSVPRRVLHDIRSGPPPDRDAALLIYDVDALPRASFVPSVVSADAARATIRYVEAAVELVRSGAATAIAAAPHSETAMKAAGIPFSGYPSLLESITGQRNRVFLMLIGGGLRIVHATLHERLRDAVERITPDMVVAAALAAVAALRSFGIAKPRIGIFGINPHAGENGLFGGDDMAITEPAVQRLRGQGFAVAGPLGADLILQSRDDFDVFVAMYHDQGHIPVKLLAGREAAALSIGADIVFSSVGHGSAFDIAGKNVADPAALVRTVRLLAEQREPIRAVNP